MEDILKFDLPIHQSSYIKVIGVGGGGGNAVNYMYNHGIEGVDFIVCNTDASALDASPVPTKIHLGKGLGAGNVPAVAEKAALDKAEEIKSYFEQNTQMVFITAGMGGGTGTGAAPVVARLLKEIELDDEEVKHILTVGVVTTPFTIEGRKRLQQAQEGIQELRKHVDALLIINNDKLKEYGEFSMTKAFELANEILNTAVKGISEIITVRSAVQIDFRDVNTVMQNSGVALMGYGSASGENRAIEAVKQAVTSPLLNDSDINGARNVLLYISSSEEHEMTMSEFEEITHFIQTATGKEVDVIWGAGTNDNLEDSLNVTLIATGFNESELFTEKKVAKVSLDDEVSSSNNVRKLSLDMGEESFEQTVTRKSESIEDEWDNIRIVNKGDDKPQSQSLADSFNAFQQRIENNNKPEIVNVIPTDEPYVSRTVKDNTDAPQIRPERMQENSDERIRQLRELSAKIKTVEGLEEIERTPAYLRRQVKLDDNAHSSDSQMPRFNLTEDGRVVGNKFLHDNVD